MPSSLDVQGSRRIQQQGRLQRGCVLVVGPAGASDAASPAGRMTLGNNMYDAAWGATLPQSWPLRRANAV